MKQFVQKSPNTLLLALHRIGPYHHARFQAAAAHFDIHVLETRPQSQEYSWSFEPQGSYTIHQLSGHLQPEADPPLPALDQQLAYHLDRLQPQAIVSVGWADRAYQRLLQAAQRRCIPLVIVSDSRQRDEPRSPAKEWLKRQLLLGYSAALVAGTESRHYLKTLGFPAEAIFEPWDVVDNVCFDQAARQINARHTCFLCVSRLVAKKNHAGLLCAYAAYQQQGGGWNLQLVGSGSLEPSIRAQIESLPDPGRVQLLAFSQLGELGQLYGQASAFVLASNSDQWGLVVNEAIAAGLPCLVSTACGCVVDLIEHGVNGWCFDPSNPAELTALMHCAERQSSADRQAMAVAARLRLNSYSLSAFASGLEQAVRYAVAQPHRSRRSAAVAQLLSRLP